MFYLSTMNSISMIDMMGPMRSMMGPMNSIGMMGPMNSISMIGKMGPKVCVCLSFVSYYWERTGIVFFLVLTGREILR